jgi:hypothetical protein
LKPTKALTLSDVRKADEALTQAQIALMETIQAAYPIGTDVTVKIGRATLKVKITRHCTAYWSRPGDLTGKNVLTGKPRNFHYTAIIEGADD